MKKYFAYSLLAAVLFGNSGAGCSKNSDDPQPQEIKLLVGGLWEVTETVTQTPSDKVTLSTKKGALGYKFHADGKLESCSYGTCVPLGRWSYQKRQADAEILTMYFENADVKEIYGDKVDGALIVHDNNHIVWAMGGTPTVGKTDYTYMRWTMERNP